MKRQNFWGFLIGFLIVAVAISFLWLRSPFFGKWTKNQFVGEIVEVSDTQLKIKTKSQNVRAINLNDKTKIVAGPRETTKADLEVKTMVVVIGEIGKDGRMEAKVIRLFPPTDKPTRQ